MSRDVEVVFTKEKKGSFTIGQTKTVKPGYAFNYLFPFNLAVPNTPEYKTTIDSIQKEAEKHGIELKKKAEKIHGILNEKTLNFQAKAHDEGKLYGSISVNDVVSKLNIDFEVDLDKHDIKGFTPIKETGTYLINVVIHSDFKSDITIVVEQEVEVEQKSGSKQKGKKGSKEASSVQTYADEETSPSTKEKPADAAAIIDDTIF
tara:strand:- start:3441 stop:4052 length:612 start_codon:yes stop_codon:yes gene_type:complete